MKKSLKQVALAAIALVLLIGLFGWLQFRGTIPTFVDTNDLSYQKLCGIKATSGKVWTSSSGWGSGGAFYRIHLQKSAYREAKAAVLIESNYPPLPHAPWWWGAKANGRITVQSGGGLGYNTKSYQVYDPDRELLFVYCEWD